jgi:alcohol dehydrogenase class IV
MSAPFSFTYGPAFRCGAGVTGEAAALLPDGPVLFVTDANVRRIGLADTMLAALEAAGRAVTIFDAVEADPSQETVLAAVSAGHAAGATGVIGFGGGSPMDVAKVAAYLLGTGVSIESIYGVGLATGRGLPLILVPTTAGTGSEATPVAVITTGHAVKKGIVAPALYADWALLDATLTTGLPPAITAATGIDAIVHAIEAYTSARLKNPLSDMLAKQALGLLTANLLPAIRNGQDLAAREAMLIGSHLAGVAFANAPVAGVHALAYPLGGHFHVPHGLSNALMLPHVLRFNLEAAMPLYAELGPIANPALAPLDERARALGLIDTLVTLAADSGLPSRLSDTGVGADHLDLLADDAMLQGRLLMNNPREITRADARRLYEVAL